MQPYGSIVRASIRFTHGTDGSGHQHGSSSEGDWRMAQGSAI